MWTEQVRGYLSGYRSNGRKRTGIRVFCYHGIVDRKADLLLERNFTLVADFKSHVQFLRQHGVIGMDELFDRLAHRTAWQEPAALITFDDGYANNLWAAEILSSFRLPYCVFISTGTIGTENTIWPVELSLLLLYGRACKLDALDRDWELNTREQREAAFQAIRQPLKAMPATQRHAIIDEIRKQFPEGETQELLHQFPSTQMLSWVEIRQLANAGVEIGSHGVDHEIHHEAQPATVRRFELTESKRIVEESLQRICSAFAFPNGDFSAASGDELQKAGYQLGFTTQARTVTSGTNRYLLPRIQQAGRLRSLVRGFFWEPA